MKSLVPASSTAGVRLSLFAPQTQLAELVADFTEWRPTPLKRDQLGWWRTTVELRDGQYRYRFRLQSNSYLHAHEMMEIADPSAPLLGSSGGLCAILRISEGWRADVDFCWKHDQCRRPLHPASIVRPFHMSELATTWNRDSDQGRFSPLLHALQVVDHLAESGVDCVELFPAPRPACDQPGAWFSPFRLLDDGRTSIQPRHLCCVIDECHAHGMHVIARLSRADQPPADSTGASTFDDWLIKNGLDSSGPIQALRCGFTHFDGRLGVCPDRTYASQAVRQWMQAFHVDGVRLAGGVLTTPQGSPLVDEWDGGLKYLQLGSMIDRSYRAASVND